MPGDPASTTAPKAGNTTDKQFIQDCLDAHNKYRTTHGVPPLTQNPELMKVCQYWANHMSQQGGKEHSNNGFGENLYFSPSESNGKAVVDNWYNEIKDYKYAGDGGSSTSHFSQVVWKGSTDIGIAFANGEKGNFYCCHYYPAGNSKGDYDANVLKP